MKKAFVTSLVGMALLLAAAPAPAGITYYPDPVYKRLNDDDPLPMEEMLELAGQGDPRAQFMLGDMYQKGKGGLAKDLKESHRWFEESGMHGYGQSFIRLAAQAKRAKKPLEAWKWYTLAIDHLNGDIQDYAIKARKELVENEPLTREEIAEARTALDDWKEQRDQRLREEKQQLKEKENSETTDKKEEKDHEPH